MFQTVVSTVSLRKPVSLAKSVQGYRIENPVTTVSLARRSTVSLAKTPMPTVSLAKRPATNGTPARALSSYFQQQDALHVALGRSDAGAARDIALAALKMGVAAADFEVLTGTVISADAAVSAAFANRYINVGRRWDRRGSKVVSLVADVENARRAA